MKIELEKYSDIEKLRNNLDKNCTINLSHCHPKVKLRIIDFLSGLVFFKGMLKKINKDEYQITMSEEM